MGMGRSLPMNSGKQFLEKKAGIFLSHFDFFLWHCFLFFKGKIKEGNESTNFQARC